MGKRLIRILIGVKVSVNAFVVVLLYQLTAVPDEDGAFGVGAVQAAFVDALFADSAAKGVVGVLPLLYFAVGFVQFGADELVFGVVFEQLAFTVGQFAQGQVAQGVVMVLCPVISGNAVALRAVQAAFAGVSGQLVEDVACGVEGEFLFGVPACVGCFENPAQLVVGVTGGAASEVGAADEVAGFVVAVAAFDEGAGTGGVLAFGALALEPAHGVVVEAADECALGPLGFAVQPVAFDVGDGLAVEGDMVQMAAAVIKGADLLAVGQCGLEAVAVGVVLVGDAGLAAVVGEGFAGDPAEGVVGVF